MLLVERTRKVNIVIRRGHFYLLARGKNILKEKVLVNPNLARTSIGGKKSAHSIYVILQKLLSDSACSETELPLLLGLATLASISCFKVSEENLKNAGMTLSNL